MKRLFLGLFVLGLLADSAYATKVTACNTTYVLEGTAELVCTGDYKGKISLVDLYKKGWRFVGSIGRSVLILEK